MAHVIAAAKASIITRLAALRWAGDGVAAAAPVIVRLLFALIAVKLIATYGSEGALTNWGIAQNTVTLLAALMGFSVQSGVAARTANGLDPSAFGRGLQLLLIGTALALLVAPVTSYLGDRGFGLPVISLVAVLSAAFAGVGSLVVSYLPAAGRVYALTSFYFVVGATTCSALVVIDAQQIDSLLLAIGAGWFGGALVFFASSRNYRRRSFWLVKRDSEQAKKLLGYGLASCANAIIQVGAILLVRDAVIDTAGLQKSDLFESSLRLATLVEGVIGSVAVIMLWRRIADNNTNVMKIVGVIFFLAMTSTFIGYLTFVFQGNAIISFLFTEEFAIIEKYDDRIFLLAVIKIAYAVLVIPLFFANQARLVILTECIYAATIYIQIFSFGLLSDPVAAAFDALIWSCLLSLGCLTVALIAVAGGKPERNTLLNE